jgi:hypothetical protein
MSLDTRWNPCPGMSTVHHGSFPFPSHFPSVSALDKEKLHPPSSVDLEALEAAGGLEMLSSLATLKKKGELGRGQGSAVRNFPCQTLKISKVSVVVVGS